MVTVEKINLIPSYCLFNDTKHIDLSLLSINKKRIKNADVEIKYIIHKILIIKIFIMNFFFVLFLMM